MIFRAIRVFPLLFVTACVTEIGAPKDAPSIRVVSDISRTDTIDAEPATKLVIEVSESRGRLDHEVEVDIAGLRSPLATDRLEMIPIDESRTQSGIISVTTSGRVAFFVKFGTVAGPAGILITVPELRLVDSLSFTVTKGKPAFIQLKPGDTAVALGATYTQDAIIIDRGGNQLADRPVFSSTSQALTVAPGGRVEPSAIVRAGVTASFVIPQGMLQETAMVSVVPAGRIAQGITLAGSSITSAIGIRSTDGALIQSFPTPQAPFEPSWSADGRTIYYAGSVGGSGSSTAQRIYSLSVADGSIREVVPETVSALSGAFLGWPAASRDGA